MLKEQSALRCLLSPTELCSLGARFWPRALPQIETHPGISLHLHPWIPCLGPEKVRLVVTRRSRGSRGSRPKAGGQVEPLGRTREIMCDPAVHLCALQSVCFTACGSIKPARDIIKLKIFLVMSKSIDNVCKNGYTVIVKSREIELIT